MKKKLSIFLAMSLSVLVLTTGCGSDDSKGAKDGSASEESQTFKIGLEAGYAPFNWTQMTDADGAVKIDGNAEYAGGYDVEIGKRLAEGLGRELVIVKTEWGGLPPALTSGKIDAIIAGMSPTADRKETIDFTDAYYQSHLVMMVKAGEDYEGATSLEDFNGSKVTAQLSTFHYDLIDQIENVKKQPAMDDFPAMRVALESGVIDAYVSERPEGISASSANEKLKMIELQDGFDAPEEDTTVAVGVKKDSELIERINEILAGISEDERQEIMNTAIKNQPAAK